MALLKIMCKQFMYYKHLARIECQIQIQIRLEVQPGNKRVVLLIVEVTVALPSQFHASLRWSKTWGIDGWTGAHNHSNPFQDWTTIRYGVLSTEIDNYWLCAVRHNRRTLCLDSRVIMTKKCMLRAKKRDPGHSRTPTEVQAKTIWPLHHVLLQFTKENSIINREKSTLKWYNWHCWKPITFSQNNLINWNFIFIQ